MTSINYSFFHNENCKWEPYLSQRKNFKSTFLIHEEILSYCENKLVKKTGHFMLFIDHLILIDDLNLYLKNPKEALNQSMVLMHFNQVSLDLTSLNNHEKIIDFMQHSLLLTYSKGEIFLCFKNENQLLFWFEKLKQVCVLHHFDQFFVKKEYIGQGSFAQVIKYERIVDKKKFAVKVFNKFILSQKQHFYCIQKSISNEILILKLLQKSFVHEIYEDKKNIYLVMKYLKGGQLQQTIFSKGNFCEKDTCAYMKQILIQLQHIHSLNIIHRDIKLENLVYKDKNRNEIEIIDFGLSQFVNDSLYSKIIPGTPGYIAPEILKNKSFDIKSDMFSLGVNILSGQQPFSRKNIQETIYRNAIGKVNYKLLECETISVYAIDLLKQLLNLDPKLRPTAEQALKHQWFQKTILNDNKIHKSDSDCFFKSIINHFTCFKKILPIQKDEIQSNDLNKCSPETKKSYKKLQESPIYKQQKQIISQFQQNELNNTADITPKTPINESNRKNLIFLKLFNCQEF